MLADKNSVRHIQKKTIKPHLSINSNKNSSKKTVQSNNKSNSEDVEKAVIKIQKWFRALKEKILFRNEFKFNEFSIESKSPVQKNKLNQPATQHHNDVQSQFAQDKVNRILSYLKNVDEDTMSMKTTDSFAFVSSNEHHQGFGGSDRMVSDRSFLRESAIFDGVKSKMMGLQIELQEKTKTIQALKTELDSTKSKIEGEKERVMKEMKTKLNLQKKSYDQIVKRHLSFVDKLLKEKEELTGKYDQISNELVGMENKYKAKLKEQEIHHQKDLKYQKEQWSATEKVKRDKWIQEKSQSIRDQTIKNLEPEIQKMLVKHQSDLKQQEEKLRNEFSKEKLNLEQQFSIEKDQMRLRFSNEKHKSLEEEREIMNRKLQQQLEKQELEFHQYKRNIQHEFDEQKQLIKTAYQEEKRLIESSFQEKMLRNTKEWESKSRLLQEEIDSLKREHKDELKAAELRWREQFKEWQQTYEEEQKLVILRREETLKAQLIKERDEEIERVIQQLSEEVAFSSNETTYKKKLQDIESRHELEIKELKRHLSINFEKLTTIQKENKDVQLQCTKMKEQVDNKVLELVEKEQLIKQQTVQLNSLKVRENVLADEIKNDFVNEHNSLKLKLKTLTKDKEILEDKLQHLNTVFEREKKRIEEEKNETLSMVESRVKKTVTIKDEMINSLRAQLQDMSLKSNHLENLIDKQREVKVYKSPIDLFRSIRSNSPS